MSPARSRQQQRWAFAAKGEAWSKRHHFDELAPKKKVSSKKRKKR
jgi:hypothetical protein